MVITLTGRFMQYYRENAKWLERTYAFVPRVGLDHLREVIVEDSRGHRRRPRRPDADVDRRLQATPGRRARRRPPPASSAPSLPLEVLPQVPVR